MKVIICGKPTPSLPDFPTFNKRVRIYEEKLPKTPAAMGRRAVAKAVRFKSELDSLFWNDPHTHWAEVFQLRWEKPIIHLDFVSMYPFCLLNTYFHHPAALEAHRGDHTQKILDGEINQGLFRCTIIPPKTRAGQWALQHHYLRYRGNNQKSYYFLWPKTSIVETMLHAEDIICLSQAGFSIKTHWGVFDPEDKPFYHPAKHLVLQELKKKMEGDCQAKKNLVRLCSDKSRIHFNREKSSEAMLKIYGKIKDKFLIWNGPSHLCAHSLYSPIRAAARTKLFTLAKTLCDPSTCPIPGTLLRCHTDGLSIGAQSPTHREELIKFLSEQPHIFIGNQPGNLKISLADGGFFLSHIIWWEHINHPQRIPIRWTGPNKNPFNTIITYNTKEKETNTINLLDFKEQGKFLSYSPNMEWKRKLPSPKGYKPTSRLKELKEYTNYVKSFINPHPNSENSKNTHPS